MNGLIGTQWREKDNRFVRVVEVVAVAGGTTPRVGRRTVSQDGKPGHPTRVTYGAMDKFLKGFVQIAAPDTASEDAQPGTERSGVDQAILPQTEKVS